MRTPKGGAAPNPVTVFVGGIIADCAATAWSSFNVATSVVGSIGSGVGRCFQGDSNFDSNMDTRVSLKLGGYITI